MNAKDNAGRAINGGLVLDSAEMGCRKDREDFFVPGRAALAQSLQSPCYSTCIRK